MTAEEPAHDHAARSLEPRELADALDAVTRRVDAADGSPLDALTRATLDVIPGAESVSLTVLERGRFDTRASTDDHARAADALQYEVGRGPCVDAVLDDVANLSGDIATDARWGEWGSRVAAELGIRSVLAYRLLLEGESTALASLNVYSDRRDAFDEAALHLGVVLATHGSLVVTAIMQRDLAANIAATLQANREVGLAMGVLMHRHRLTREQAFDLLRLAGQEHATSLADVATMVAETGDLAMLRPRLGGSG